MKNIFAGIIVAYAPDKTIKCASCMYGNVLYRVTWQTDVMDYEDFCSFCYDIIKKGEKGPIIERLGII